MKKSVLLWVVAILAIAAIGFYIVNGHGGRAEQATQQAGAAPTMAVPVSVLVASKKDVDIRHSLPGRVTPFRQSQVRPQVSGVITKRLFEEGAQVEQGDQLYQIDDARYKARYNAALADLKSARSNAKSVQAREARYKDLVAINAVSQQEYDDIKAQIEQANAAIAVAQSAVDLAKVDLNYTKVYAPIAGRVGKSLVTEGALVTANQPQHLAVITQTDPVYVDIQQSGAEAITLSQHIRDKENVPVRISFDGEAGETYPEVGELKFSEVTMDESSGSIALRAVMPNPKGVLLTGLFVTAELDLGVYNLMMIPQRAAIRTPQGGLAVWVVDANDHAQPRPIEARYAYQNQWIVRTGLQDGERVVIEGYQKLRPGVPVMAQPWRDASAAQAAPSAKAATQQPDQASEE